jgi:hypothetical protein
MRLRLVLGVVALAGIAAVPLTASADPVPPACVVVDQAPLHLQVGYAPAGPDGCTHLP